MAARDYDLLIAGGGPVGASLACALHGQGLRVGLVEARARTATDPPSADDRSLALAYGARRILEALGLWQGLNATPILAIHVSNRGRPGFTRFDHRAEGVEALGYVVSAQHLSRMTWERLGALPDTEVLCPAQISHVETTATGLQVTLQTTAGSIEANARLLVGADGAHSELRALLGIEASRWDYGQTAIIANLRTELPHGNVAFERFTDSGPLALLPLDATRCALILTVPSAAAADLLALGDAAFLALAQQRFGERLGRFLTTGPRAAFPLALVRTPKPIATRVALIGNAAHTLHPIAAQGLNLGLRDVAALAEVVSDALRQGQDIGADPVLRRYAAWRRSDQRHTWMFTDGLVRVFGNPLAPVAILRNAAMLTLDLCPSLKHSFARANMGLSGRLPRLALGLPLTPRTW